MSEVVDREFTGVWIPRELYLAKDLSWTEKILVVEINSLDRDPEKGCYASNAYLGEFLGVSEGTAANLVSKLKKKGYVFELWSDGKHRGLYTSLRTLMLHEKMKHASRKDEAYASRKDEHSNKGSSNTRESAARESVFVKTKRVKNKEQSDEEFLAQLRSIYDWVDVDVELKKAAAWAERKGRRLTRAFFADSWMSNFKKDTSEQVIETRDTVVVSAAQQHRVEDLPNNPTDDHFDFLGRDEEIDPTLAAMLNGGRVAQTQQQKSSSVYDF